MKKLLTSLLLLLSIVGCEKELDTNTAKYPTQNNKIENGKVVAQMKFVGDVVVKNGSGAEFVGSKNIVSVYAQGENLGVKLHEMRFAEAMPKMDMVMPSLAYTGSERTLSTTTLSVVPEIGNIPFKKYTMENIALSVDNTRLKLTFDCNGNSVNYEGTLFE